MSNHGEPSSIEIEEQVRKKLKFSRGGGGGGGDEGGRKKKSPRQKDNHTNNNYAVLGNTNVVSSSPEDVLTSETSQKHHEILSNFKVLTGEKHRDKWLERLLESAFNLHDHSKTTHTEKKHTSLQNQEIGTFPWPDSVVPVVVALEKIAHDTLSLDSYKYNRKMRQIIFNLKLCPFLAQRFLIGELEPSQLLNMSPDELKVGATAEKCAEEETHEEQNRFQMTEASCRRCKEKKVGVIDIIQTGLSERYQLECNVCGNTWYAPRDDVAELTIESPRAVGSVGTAPLATAKFQDVVKTPSRISLSWNKPKTTTKLV